MTLLLFDIDGTLLHANGASGRAVERTLTEFTGQPISLADVSLSGRTDWGIMRGVLRDHGLDATDALVRGALTAYAEAATTALGPGDIDALPGARDLVGRLAERSDVQLALVTGNVRAMAYAKLEAIGLADVFPFGAFGDDREDRSDLPPLALDRAKAHTGHSFDGARSVVIGDTRRDITCSRSIGARAVAVCTDRYSRDDLAPHGPDLLLDDLRDTDTVIQHLVGPNGR